MKYFQNLILNKLATQETTLKVKNILLQDKIVKISSDSLKYENIFLNLAMQLGKLMPMEENIITGNKTGKLLVDIKYQPTKSKSFLHNDTRQPFHTDGSYEYNAPDLTLFFCKKPAKYGGATIFIQNIDLIKVCKKYNEKMYKQILKTKLRFFKGNDEKIKEIINKRKDLNWNYFRATPTSLTIDFHDFLENKIYQGGIFEEINLVEGEVIIFPDTKYLHGRNSFIGDRWLRKGGIKWI